jgi:oligosaccharide repeat unit polymerase
MPELTTFIYIIVTVGTIWLGVRVYGRWINHITIYGVVWGTQIILYQLRLIKYPDLSLETTVLIFGAWAIFVISSLTIRNFYSAKEAPIEKPRKANSRLITIVLTGLIVVGTIGTLQHWMVLIRTFGGVKSVIINGNLVYSALRSESGIPGMWPYIDSVTLSADFFGGYFAGLRQRPVLLGIVPIFVELAEAISGFGRARLVIGTVLWGSAFFLPHLKRAKMGRHGLIKRAILITLIITIFAFGMEFVRSFRGARETFSGETTALSHVRGIGFITPSIYLYLSSDVAVLNKFLDYEFAGKVEHTPVGGNTLGPFFRFFAKFGIVDPMPAYQKFYAVPVGTNTGSYLRELYADWGILGTLVAVYLLGALTSWAFEVYHRKKTLVSLAFLSHLYVVVFFSFAVQGTSVTYWLISLVASMLAASIVDKPGKDEGWHG